MQKRMRVISFVLIATLLFASVALSSCAAVGDVEETASTTESERVTETESETETESVTETETETASETETETEPPTTEAETEPVFVYPETLEENGRDGISSELIVPTEDGSYINPLTGLVCTQEQSVRRPVAVMFNNIATALPQQQISAADVLYECEVEGGLTRLLGVFNEYEDLKAIGSIRSAREYYIDFAANHDAIFVHAGGSDSAYVDLKGRAVANIDGVNGGGVTAFFYRDPQRLLTMRLEHTLVIDGDRLQQAIAYRGYRTSYSPSFQSPLRFVGSTQRISLVGDLAAEANAVTVKFGSHTTTFSYDAESMRYLRSQNGNIHIDGSTGEQLGFENMIVLFCPYSYTNDAYNHITISDVGTGNGYYFTGGMYIPIKWSKSNGDAPVSLMYSSGQPLVLSPGKTNIEIVSSASRLSVQ